jgi:hypothetical protein
MQFGPVLQLPFTSVGQEPSEQVQTLQKPPCRQLYWSLQSPFEFVGQELSSQVQRLQ